MWVMREISQRNAQWKSETYEALGKVHLEGKSPHVCWDCYELSGSGQTGEPVPSGTWSIDLLP